MKVLIVGSGKLASELLNELIFAAPVVVERWNNRASTVKEPSVVVHAGSGRELDEVLGYCHDTNSILIELATGSEIECSPLTFPIVVCPNTNILMLKFMNMLAKSGSLFADYRINLIESHQSEKRSTPGTAVAIAHSVGLSAEDVISVRDREKQLRVLHIPPEHLGRHAVHSIVIEDGACRILFETRVYGSSPYAEGVSKIVTAATTHNLENKIYAIDEFVENGWV